MNRGAHPCELSTLKEQHESETTVLPATGSKTHFSWTIDGTAHKTGLTVVIVLQVTLLFLIVSCTAKQQHPLEKFQNVATVVINLDELSVKEIPDEIGQLTSVTDLNIQVTPPTGNWEVYPPLSWYETRELKEPFLKLPGSIGQLKSLRSLHLSNLDIGKLPESISELRNLEFLDLSMNKLELSNELAKLTKLPKLKHLIVLGNHFDAEEMQEFQLQHPYIKVVYKE